MEFKNTLRDYAAQAGMKMDEESAGKFESYFTMLVEKNKVMNLTALTEPQDVMLKHFIDSLYAYNPEVFTTGAMVCDLGTGAGFPGIPLKIMHQDLQMTLVDSLGKRLKFLEEVIKELDLPGVETCHLRAEDAGQDKNHRARYDVVTARAVAGLPVLLEYCLPLVKKGGYFVAMKASNYEQELEESQKALKVLGGELAGVQNIQLPTLEDKRVIIYVRKIKDTPKEYPRRAGTPEKNPLK